MNILFSLLLFANLNGVATLPEETNIVSNEVMTGQQKRTARRKLERMGK